MGTQLLVEIYAHALQSEVDPELLSTDWVPFAQFGTIQFEHQERLKELLEEFESGTVIP